jgi:hypothetical protein
MLLDPAILFVITFAAVVPGVVTAKTVIAGEQLMPGLPSRRPFSRHGLGRSGEFSSLLSRVGLKAGTARRRRNIKPFSRRRPD